MHWVYILKCADGSHYVGETTDPETREQLHNEGRGGKYTTRRRPVELVYSEPFNSRDDALRRERQLKGWTSAKKTALVRGDLGALKSLSRTQQGRSAKAASKD